MNKLSSSIYFMGVADAASSLFTLLAVASSVAAVGLLIWYLVLGFNPKEQDVQASRPFFGRIFCIWIGVVFVGWGGYMFSPSRQTLLLIAGSEVGERVLRSQAVSDVVNPGMDLLKAWIKSETDKLTKK